MRSWSKQNGNPNILFHPFIYHLNSSSLMSDHIMVLTWVFPHHLCHSWDQFSLIYWADQDVSHITTWGWTRNKNAVHFKRDGHLRLSHPVTQGLICGYPAISHLCGLFFCVWGLLSYSCGLPSGVYRFSSYLCGLLPICVQALPWVSTLWAGVKIKREMGVDRLAFGLRSRQY